MRLSEVAKLLSGEMSPADFRATNTASFVEYGELSKKRGSAIPIRVEEDFDLLVTSEHIARACELLVSGDLLPDELAYMADVLQLADRVSFENEEIPEYISEFTDPEINGPFTSQRARDIIGELRNHT